MLSDSLPDRCYLSAILIAIAAFALLESLYFLATSKMWKNTLHAVNSCAAGPAPRNYKVSMGWGAAIGVYVMMVVLLVLFVVPRSNGALDGAAWGAILGFLVYGVFNFTCVAIFKRYPAGVAAIDTVWGALMFAGVGALCAYASINWRIIGASKPHPHAMIRV